MPTYEFLCQKCGQEFALILSMRERESEKITCPHCGAEEVTQQLSAIITKTSRKS